MLNEQASTMMWPKSMQSIVASIAKILSEDNFCFSFHLCCFIATIDCGE